MAMNTTVQTGTITPIQTNKPTSSTTTKTSSSNLNVAFQPETQVDLDNSVKSMLSQLGKIALKQGSAEKALPEEVQKLVDVLMKNAFSVDKSLAQGLGDVLQSQRFTLDQLQLLSKFLDQIGTMIEGKQLTAMPDELKTLLSNIRLLAGSDGHVLDEMVLTKLAFQLLDGKKLSDLPEALQFLLQNTQVAIPGTGSENSGLQFLKQLVQYFMPKSPDGEAAPGKQPQVPGQQQGAQGSQNQGTTPNQQVPGQQQGAQGSQNQGTTPNQQVPGQQQGAQGSQNQGTTPNQQVSGQQQGAQGSQNQGTTPNQQVPGQPQGAQGSQNQGTTPNQQVPGQPQGAQGSQNQGTTPNQQVPGQPQGAQGSQNQGTTPNQQLPGQQQGAQGSQNQGTTPNQQVPGQPQGAQGSQNQGTTTNQQVPGQQQGAQGSQNQGTTPNQQLPGQQQGAQGSQTSGTLLAQNSAEIMRTLKGAAIQIMKNTSLSETELGLLKKFAISEQKALTEQEAKQLQTLLRLSEENIPAAVRQAAIRQEMPELPKLWAFVQLCNLTRLLDLQSKRLRDSGKNIQTFANLLKSSLGNENEVMGNQRTMSFMTPLYMGDNEKCYPAYIHVYDETSGSDEDGELKKETWLRLCLLTENIGAVELVFRVYEKNNVNLRVAFSQEDTVESFYEYIPELRQAFSDLPLVLNDIKVEALGG